LEFIHDCLIFDGGVKKAARPNQYFALKAAQYRVRNKEAVLFGIRKDRVNP
jgi:type I restriction enzyme R subunit